jgi:hypothetical protein
MTFYAFRLELINVITPRSRGLDDDVVTFGVLVNQVDRGHGTGTFPSLAAGSSTPAAAVPPGNRKNMNGAWECGPFEFAPGDLVHVFYSGYNIADAHNITLDTQKQDEIELKILDAILSGAVGAIGGPLGSVIGGILGAITDPVGTLLGFEPPVRCDGLVFSDAVQFSGAGLDNLAMGAIAGEARPGIRFTRNHTDAATHDSKCGEVARTDIVFSVFRVPSVSVRSLLASRFNASASAGLRHLAGPAGTISVKALLGITA